MVQVKRLAVFGVNDPFLSFLTDNVCLSNGQCGYQLLRRKNGARPAQNIAAGCGESRVFADQAVLCPFRRAFS